MTIVLDDRPYATPGFESVSWLDDRMVPRATDFNTRTLPIVAQLLHTVHGDLGPLRPGAKPSARAERYAVYQAGTDREVSWDYTVDTDGTVVVSNDPVRRFTWHAGARDVNAQSLGVEAVQDDDGAQYEAGIEAEVALVEFNCERLHIPRRTPVTADGKPFRGLLDERLFRGVYGHRNLWKLKDGRRVTMKGLGDPDDHVFLALLRRGFQGVIVDASGRPIEPAAPPPPPAWVDLSQEIIDTSDLPVDPAAFVRDGLRVLTGMGLTRDRAVEVVAHCATECGWGRRAIGGNLGGVKLKREDDAEFRRKHDHGLGWWRAQGHVAAGDAAWVYYRAFADAEEFFRFWSKRYVPRDGAAGERYTATGAAFWGAEPANWFAELLRAGYRGPVREQEIKDLLDRGADVEAHDSVRSHRSVAARVRSIADAG